MPVSRSHFWIVKGVRAQDIAREDVRMAWVLRLPFRLRVGEFFRHSLRLHERCFEIVLRNRVQISTDTQVHEVMQSQKPEHLWSDVLIYMDNPRVEQQALDAVRNWDPSLGDRPVADLSANIFKAIEALNRFIVAYATSVGSVLGGQPLHSFRDLDFFEHLEQDFVILVPPGAKLTDDDFKRILGCESGKKVTSTVTVRGSLHDLPIEELSERLTSVLLLQRKFIHYEYAFEARAKMFARDSEGALLMAIVALEAAHAAFVLHELGARLGSDGATRLVDDFLRELGLSLSNQLTPYLLMDETERPSSDIIQACGRGISIRNEIMHALRNKRENYRIRTRGSNEISDAYSAVLKVYEYYVAALERRVNAVVG